MTIDETFATLRHILKIATVTILVSLFMLTTAVTIRLAWLYIDGCTAKFTVCKIVRVNDQMILVCEHKDALRFNN